MASLWKGALAGLVAWCAFAAQAGGECIRVPDMLSVAPQNAVTGTRLAVTPPPEAAAGAVRRDANGRRIVAPVVVNGQGPFPFIVDTGANRSVLSHGLAQRLGISSTRMGDVHTIEGVTIAPMVDVQSLTYGGVPLNNSALPLLAPTVMAGEQGVLGVDGMAGKRLRMDFERRCIEIAPSRHASPLSGWATIRGEMRFGHLVIIRGRVGRTPVNVLLDTGSDLSLANLALRDALLRTGSTRRADLNGARAYTAGRPIVLDAGVIVPTLHLGADVTVSDISLYVGNYHIFDLWGLMEEPTVLVGMDVLTHARGIAIDYERATIHIRLPNRNLSMSYGDD